MDLVKTMRENLPLTIVCALLLAHALVMFVGGILKAAGDSSLFAAELAALSAIWPLLWVAGRLLPVAIAYDKSRATRLQP